MVEQWKVGVMECWRNGTLERLESWNVSMGNGAMVE